MEIIPEYFFSTLLVGFLIMFMIFPQPKVVLRSPTPKNAGNTMYVDKQGVCYRYKKTEVVCDGNQTVDK